MSAAITVASTLLEAQSNTWQGPTASSSSTTPTSSIIKTPTSSLQRIKRKPVPKIPAELLLEASNFAGTSAALASQPVAASETILKSTEEADTTPVAVTTPAVPTRTTSEQRPQKQYILDIDSPAKAEEATSSSNDVVKQLLRSASMSPSAAATRSTRGPLRWMQDKETTPAAASSTLAPPSPQPKLTRKTSITAHLKLSLRRNKAEDKQPTKLAISGPSNFVHLSTGTDASSPTANETSLRRAPTTSKASQRSSLCSSISSISEVHAPTTPEPYSEDRPLYSLMEHKQPLRPLKSIRRPSNISLNQDVEISPGLTSPSDKRKGICVAPTGTVPSILEPINVKSSGASEATKLSPIASPAEASHAGENFAAALERTLSRTHRLGSDAGELSPGLAPELSRSPSSGYESSSSSSSRSSLASLNEFSSFVDFPDMAEEGVHAGKDAGEKDIWAQLGRESESATPTTVTVPLSVRGV